MHTPAPLPPVRLRRGRLQHVRQPPLRRGAQRAAEPAQHAARQPRHRADHGLWRSRARRLRQRRRQSCAGRPARNAARLHRRCQDAGRHLHGAGRLHRDAVFATGDPLFAGVRCVQERRHRHRLRPPRGDRHDGMEYFGLSATGQPDPANNDRALLGINHEYITPQFLHASRPVGAPAAGQRNRHRGRLPRRRHRRIRQGATASSPTCRARPSTAASRG